MKTYFFSQFIFALFFLNNSAILSQYDLAVHTKSVVTCNHITSSPYSPNALANFGMEERTKLHSKSTGELKPNTVGSLESLKQLISKGALNFPKVGEFTCVEDIPNDDDALFLEGKEFFESWAFEKSQRVFFEYTQKHPEDNVALFYLALNQFYRSQYSSAIKNFSLLNMRISIATKEAKSELLDDIRFYFALSTVMVPETQEVTKSLFKKLNYEGGKYQSVSVGLVDFL